MLHLSFEKLFRGAPRHRKLPQHKLEYCRFEQADNRLVPSDGPGSFAHYLTSRASQSNDSCWTRTRHNACQSVGGIMIDLNTTTVSHASHANVFSRAHTENNGYHEGQVQSFSREWPRLPRPDGRNRASGTCILAVLRWGKYPASPRASPAHA